MVVLDSGAAVKARLVPLPKISLPGLIALMAAVIVLGSLAARGFSGPGWVLASQNAWRFTALTFFAALVAGPLGRLVPGLGRPAAAARHFGWGFCASCGVYLAVSLIYGPSAGGLLFAMSGAFIALVMAAALVPGKPNSTGEAVRRTLLGLSAIYFWLCHALTGLSHLSHPHRPDSFYGLSLSLMILALLIRFADACAAEWRRPLRRSMPA